MRPRAASRPLVAKLGGSLAGTPALADWIAALDLYPDPVKTLNDAPEKHGVGIANVKTRLQLHYGSRQSFTIQEVTPGDVTAIFLLPLEIDKSPSSDHPESLYAASSSDRG